MVGAAHCCCTSAVYHSHAKTMFRRRFSCHPMYRNERRYILFATLIFVLIIVYNHASSIASPKDVSPRISVSDASGSEKPSTRSFTVSGDNFLKDGQPFNFYAGTAHYWRRPHEYWEDTMIKMKALGLNTVQTYISWNLHEPEPEEYDFEGGVNIIEYFKLAEKHGLLVIVRPGPFINAEADKGGLPYWLMREDPKMKLRTNDPLYFNRVEKWFRKVLPMLKPLLYANGGPIILVQIENEYGSYPACDKKYLESLRDLNREILGSNVLLYTTDGPRPDRIACGRVDGAVTTVDWGGGRGTDEVLKVFRLSVPMGPFANSEFYPGWINHWSRDWNVVPYQPVVKSMEEIISLHGSFTLYPVVGGTNFGFTVGSNMYDGVFLPGTSSYDFDAPISEAGDLTEKYWKLRDVLKKTVSIPLPDPPAPSKKGKYGTVRMKFAGSLFDNLLRLNSGSPVKAEHPLTFEVLKQAYGFVLYRCTIQGRFRDPAILNIPYLGDRAAVFIDKRQVGTMSRTSGLTALNIFAKSGQVLDILVHNEGRITVGNMTGDFKGIIGPVTLQNTTLLNWEHYPISLPSYPAKNPKPLDLDAQATFTDDKLWSPGFYTGVFQSSPPQDCFLRMNMWHQGYAFVNGWNLGRYWPAEGPQMTLFVPGVFLKSSGDNILQLFEFTKAPCQSATDCVVEIVDEPVQEPKSIYVHTTYDPDAVIKKYGVATV